MLCSGAQDKPIGKGNLLPPPPSLIILQQLHSASQLKGLKHASQIIYLGGNSPDAPRLGWIAESTVRSSNLPGAEHNSWPAWCAA